MNPVTAAVLAGGSLVAGFAVAQITGVRALGGVVLLVALAWCVVQWRRLAGAGVAAGLGVGYLALFVAAHLLADLVTAWPAVVAAAVVMAGASLWSTCLAPARRDAPTA